MKEEQTFQPPEMEPGWHPVAQLFTNMVADLANSDEFVLRESIDMAGLSNTIECVSNLARRVRSAGETESLERLVGKIVTEFASFLTRYWNMSASVRAAHGGEFCVQVHALLNSAATPVTTRQHH